MDWLYKTAPNRILHEYATIFFYINTKEIQK